MRLYAHIRRADMGDGRVRVQATLWAGDDDHPPLRLSKVGRVVRPDAPPQMVNDVEARLRDALTTLCIEEKEMPGMGEVIPGELFADSKVVH